MIKRFIAYPILYLLDVTIWLCGVGQWRELRRESKNVRKVQ